MGADKPTNIFDEAGRSRKPISKAKGKPPASVSPKVNKGDQNIPLDELISNVNKSRDEVVTKLDLIQKELGMSVKDVKEYLNNPRNFKPEQWVYLKEQKKAMQDKLVNELGPDIVKLAEKAEISKTAKERKGKTLGARKNWISMR